MSKYCIIIPIYNEEKCIEKFIESINKINLKNYEKYIYFIDDKSNDNTKHILKKIANTNKNYYIFENKINLGQNKSLKENLNLINSHNIYLTLDGDGQHPIHEIENLVDMFFSENLDLLHGKKIK